MTIEFLIDKNLEAPSKKEKKEIKKIIKKIEEKPKIKQENYLQKSIFLRQFTLALIDAWPVVKKLEEAEKNLEETKQELKVKKEIVEKVPIQKIPHAPFYLDVYKKIKSSFKKMPLTPSPINLYNDKKSKLEEVPVPMRKEITLPREDIIIHKKPFEMGIDKKVLKETLDPNKGFLPRLPRQIKFKSN